jgi:hypothetical protein
MLLGGPLDDKTKNIPEQTANITSAYEKAHPRTPIPLGFFFQHKLGTQLHRALFYKYIIDTARTCEDPDLWNPTHSSSRQYMRVLLEAPLGDDSSSATADVDTLDCIVLLNDHEKQYYVDLISNEPKLLTAIVDEGKQQTSSLSLVSVCYFCPVVSLAFTWKDQDCVRFSFVGMYRNQRP